MNNNSEKKVGRGMGILINFARISILIAGILAIWFSVEEVLTYIQVSQKAEGQIIDKSIIY